MEKILSGFFFGCSSPEGFKSFADGLYSPHDGGYAYIIKGAPGTGKSTLMKKIAKELNEHGIETEHIFCSSDPESLDAVLIPQFKKLIIDGTSPHALEPKYIGVCEEYIDLTRFLDKAALSKNRDKIMELTDKNKYFHMRCRRFLQSAAFVHEGIKKIADSALDLDKVQLTAKKIAKAEFNSVTGKIGRENLRVISAPTSQGIKFMSERVFELCERFYVLEDEYFSFAPSLLSFIRSYALGAGLDIITSPHFLSQENELEHILIPDLRLGFISSHRYHKFKGGDFRKINSSAFYNRDIIKERQNVLKYRMSAEDEFISDALFALEKSKDIHDDIEREYISAMDFKELESIKNHVISSIID